MSIFIVFEFIDVVRIVGVKVSVIAVAVGRNMADVQNVPQVVCEYHLDVWIISYALASSFVIFTSLPFRGL